jgi:hypothetical protein
MTPKTPRARLDANRTAQPKTRLIGHGELGHCLGPGSIQADALENTETGERIPLGHSHLYKDQCPLCTPEPTPQAQNSLTDQLKELLPVANRLGLYDAADFLTTIIKRAERS